MARRMRRRRAGRPAGPFATSVKNGRARSWESVANHFLYDDWDTVFPNTALVVAGRLVNYRVLTPINVTRGIITLQRVRGEISIGYRVGEIAAAGGFTKALLPMNIQLVPARNGGIVDEAVLDPTNSADLESNRILWRYTSTIYPGVDQNGLQVAGNRYYFDRTSVDIKVSRRYDVSEWALIWVIEADAVDIATNIVMLEARGLYLATDGV